MRPVSTFDVHEFNPPIVDREDSAPARCWQVLKASRRCLLILAASRVALNHGRLHA